MNATEISSMSITEYASYLEKYYKFTVIPSELDRTQENNMISGRIYDYRDTRLTLGRQRGNEITVILNQLTKEKMDDGRLETDDEYERRREALTYLLLDGNMGQGCRLESIQVDYGSNMILGKGVVLKSNIVVLDCARVMIGDNTFVGDGVQLFAGTHPTNPLLREKCDFAMQVSIGKDCWIGPRAIICPGVDIGDGTVVEAGSIITKNVPSYVVVAGSPAKIVKVSSQEEYESQALSQDSYDWTPTPVGTLVI